MSQVQLDTLSQVFSEHNLRVTAARQKLFLLLLQAEPQSMRQLLMAATDIDRVSVYRNVALFEQLGIVHRIYNGWKYTLELSDDFIDHHHHMTCLSCGTIIDIADERHIDDFIHHVAAQSGFTPRRRQFEIDGYCRNCQSATIEL